MTVPDRMWSALRLDPETVAARARFYRSYATLADPPFEIRDLAELFRYGSPDEWDAPVVNLLGPGAHPVGARLRAARRPAVGANWVRVAEVADALRNAAIAEMLLDLEAGRQTLLTAGRRYIELGLPYGDFLAVTATGDRRLSSAAAQRLAATVSGEPTESAEPGYAGRGPAAGQRAGSGPLGPTAGAVPAQQRYLLLAAAADAAALVPMLTEAPQARRTTAVGGAAQPLSTWWWLGIRLSRLGPNDESGRREVAATISDLAESHGRQLLLAAADGHHWSTGRARTDLIDLEVAGVMAISTQIMAWRGIRPWSVTEDFRSLPPLAELSLDIGRQLGGDEPPTDRIARMPRPFGP